MLSMYGTSRLNFVGSVLVMLRTCEVAGERSGVAASRISMRGKRKVTPLLVQ